MFFLLVLVQSPILYGKVVFIGLSYSSLIVAIYLYNKTTDFEDSINVKAGDLQNQSYILKPLALFFLLLPLPYLLLIKEGFIYVYFLIALNGYLYSTPILPGHFRFKNFFITKLISATSTIAVPVFYSRLVFGDISFSSNSLFHFLPIIIIVLVGELFWDIRDIKGDKEEEVLTIPVLIGEKLTAIICSSLLLFILVLTFSKGIYEVRDSIMYIVSLIITIFITFFASYKRPWWYFHLYIVIWALELFATLILGR